MINRGGRTSGTGADSEPRKTGRHRAGWGGGQSAIFHYANKTHELTFSMAIANQPQTRDVLDAFWRSGFSSWMAPWGR